MPKRDFLWLDRVTNIDRDAVSVEMVVGIPTRPGHPCKQVKLHLRIDDWSLAHVVEKFRLALNDRHKHIIQVLANLKGD